MTLPRAPRVTACADAILQRVDLLNNPYFKALGDGSMSKECFRATQEQFLFAVRYFPRPMAALISRLPEPTLRIGILHNIVEEHGDFEESRFHQNTFRQFLSSIGSAGPKTDGPAMWPAVHAFNSILMSACACDELETGVCCLGIIERAFADISTLIGRAVVGRGWVAPNDLVHYTVHAELDVRHADDFFAMVEPEWDDPRRRCAVEQGLELGAYAFDALYRGLYTRAAQSR
ncbi:MAG: iron-containing redox enzyme family protein [Phycisphaerales bacterium]|nr:iron-containing redox enzyme family protein [Phycisphaerales bacterium]MDB5354130.1 iron-containing redox enzyme family protein [Phycisphaerales bacterium]